MELLLNFFFFLIIILLNVAHVCPYGDLLVWSVESLLALLLQLLI